MAEKSTSLDVEFWLIQQNLIISWNLFILISLLGSYSFVDPKHKVRTVQYAADETGFHASLINYEDTIAQPIDSEAVRLAKERHFRLYQKIAEANSHGVPVNLPRVTNIWFITSSAGIADTISIHIFMQNLKF